MKLFQPKRVLFMVLGITLGAIQAQAKIAIYRDQGVWGPSYRHLLALLNRMQSNTITVTARDIRQGALRANIETLIIPGGKSWEYLESLGDLGAQEIREVGWWGGGYLGILCRCIFSSQRP